MILYSSVCSITTKIRPGVGLDLSVAQEQMAPE